MRRLLKRGAALLLACLLLTGALALGASAAEIPGAGKTATILFTHEMHSHLLPAPREGGGEYGGLAFVILISAATEDELFDGMLLDVTNTIRPVK